MIFLWIFDVILVSSLLLELFMRRFEMSNGVIVFLVSVFLNVFLRVVFVDYILLKDNGFLKKIGMFDFLS